MAQRGEMRGRFRIVLDARPLSHPQSGGFRTYVAALLRGLGERRAGDFDLVLYVDRPLSGDALALVPVGAEVRELSASRMKTDLRLFPQAVRRDRPDLVHGVSNYLPLGLGRVRTVVTVHDAMGVARYPWDAGVPRTPRERFINRYWARLTVASAQKARRIITVSHGSAGEVAKALRLPRERITVVYNGLAQPAPRVSGPQTREYAVLALASPDARKNLETLFLALTRETARFGGGVAPRLDLVCTSDTTARRAEDALRRHNITNFQLVRNLDDQALADTFARASVFAWPSRLEGFGLPPLEALRAGCAVASSCAPAMPEALGDDAPVYFDPTRPNELADALALLLAEDDAAHAARALQGRERAETFTCRRMADETVAVWERVLAGDTEGAQP